AHVKTMLSNHFDTSYYQTVFRDLQELTASELVLDTNKYFTMDQFTKAADSTIRSGSIMVPGVFQLMEARINYLKSLSPITAVAPIITNLKSNKAKPNWNESFTITATCSLANSQAIYLYVKRSKTASFERQVMYDDGLHGDGLAGDMIYGANFIMSSANFYYYMLAENNDAATFEPARAAFIYHTLQVNSPEPTKGSLVLNEFLASNKKSDINEYGAYEDWIELYNNSSDTIDMSGFQLSDNYNNPAKFIFPIGTKIAPKAYKAVWADEFPSSAKYLHTGFGLSAVGEELILSDAFGAVLDSISFGAQTTDKPMGRCPNGTGMFVQIEKTSFNDANIFCTVGLEKNELSKKSVFLYPNPSEGKFTLFNPSAEPIQVMVYDWQGRLCFSGENLQIIDLGNLDKGYYFAVFKNEEGATIGTQKLLIIY
ncbi:MAG: lamin tail domain-containing protein, partial [Bacteroidia bacterium]|nr:lamin tail domain-containing protein [Bacteroidia bacterium]